MRTWIVLLRGLNMAGAHKVSMAELRGVLAELGFEDIRTYGQSGNCILRSDIDSAEDISRRVAAALEQRFGFRPLAIVLTPEALERALAGNPFATADPKAVSLIFLDAPPVAPDLAGLRALAENGDDFALRDRILYLHTPNGAGRSKLAARIPRFVKTGMTGRALTVVRALADRVRTPN